jgi:hypothetical protein
MKGGREKKMRSKLTVTILWPLALGVACILLVAGSVSTVKAEVVAADGFTVITHYANPHEEWEEDGVTFKEVINSFVYGPDRWLRRHIFYYTTGIRTAEVRDDGSIRYNCAAGFKVYKLKRWWGCQWPVLIFHDPNAIGLSGGRIFAIDGKVYFNDGGTKGDRGTLDYYRYDPKNGSITKIHDSLGDREGEAPDNVGAVDLWMWGLSTYTDTDFLGAGRVRYYVDPDTRITEEHMFYSSLNGDILSLSDIGIVSTGSGTGPVTVGPDGSLFYGDGGFGDTYIWRFSAADVFAAIAGVTPLDPAMAEEFALICDRPDNCPDARGVSSMVVNDELGLVVTGTEYHYPSWLRAFSLNPGGDTLIATSDGRMGEVRNVNGRVYFCDPDGIYKVYLTDGDD